MATEDTGARYTLHFYAKFNGREYHSMSAHNLTEKRVREMEQDASEIPEITRTKRQEES